MKIFGKYYPTKDGTCIRDYIHVIDIAQGHIIVLNAFEKENEKLFNENTVIYNMGTNKGYSVKEIIETYEKVNGIKLNYTYGEKRDGDTAISIPECSKIKNELGWIPKIGLEQMCKDSYNFVKLNPNGLYKQWLISYIQFCNNKLKDMIESNKENANPEEIPSIYEPDNAYLFITTKNPPYNRTAIKKHLNTLLRLLKISTKNPFLSYSLPIGHGD